MPCALVVLVSDLAPYARAGFALKLSFTVALLCMNDLT